ncbi:hypothetical protein [Candidatus Regiella insecticola]|uniref:Uncharacterized protein n=1 Tax=Candidatus Regiella insecticola TaxID=138073 RepID=A0A6L2ZM42_9ENTR|nr:hypothetical protein [Candidatus Regiella insecticola]GFN45917.1 hypothetical protein RINTU1_12920 [Candidatus Regiella insecticola]
MLFTTNVQTSLIKPITEVFIYSVKTCSKLISSLMGVNQSVLKMMPPNVSKSDEENTIPHKNDEEFVVVINPNPNPIKLDIDFKKSQKKYSTSLVIEIFKNEIKMLSNKLNALIFSEKHKFITFEIREVRVLNVFKKVDGSDKNKEIISKRIAFLEERIKALELKMFKDKVKELQIILNEMEMSLDSDDVSIESAINIQYKMLEIPKEIEKLKKRITELEQLKEDSASFVIITKLRD